MRLYIFFGFVLSLVVVLSLFLVPRKSELALMHMKDRQYGLAKIEFEKQSASGDLSVSVTIPLMKLYLHFGEISNAVQLMERYVDKNQNDIVTRDLLGKLYKDALMPDNYLSNLETIAKIEPTEERLQEIAHLYEKKGLSSKRIETLKKLVHEFPQKPQSFLGLAYLQAKEEKFNDALNTLELLYVKHPDLISPRAREFHVSLLFKTEQYELANQQFSEWLTQKMDGQEFIQVIEMFRSRGQGRRILQTMLAHENTLDNNIKLQIKLIELQMENGQRKQGVVRMEKLFNQEALPEHLVSDYFTLALETHLYFGEIKKAVHFAEALVKKNPNDIATRDLLGELYKEALMPDQYLSNLEKISKVEPTEGRLREISYQYGIKGLPSKRIETLKRLVNEYSGKPENYFTLAYIQARKGDSRDALNTLELMEAKHFDSISQEARELYINLLLDTEQYDLASEKIFEWMKKKFDPVALNRIILLLNSRGQGLRSLKLMLAFEISIEKDPRLLTHMIELEIANNQRKHALERIQRLHKKKHLPDSVVVKFIDLFLEEKNYPFSFHLARTIEPKIFPKNSLVDLAETALASDDLKFMRTVMDKFGNDYLSSQPLLAAKIRVKLNNDPEALRWLIIASGQPDLSLDQAMEVAFLYSRLEVSKAKELPAFILPVKSVLLNGLNASNISQARMQDLVNGLLNLKDDKSTLPYLENLAITEGGDWIFYYEEALKKLELNDKLAKFWVVRASQPNISSDEKRTIAYQLLDLNLKSKAENLFQELAKTASPDSPDVKQLMFLWGPSINTEGLDWLVSRAKESNGGERTEWMKHLINVGAAQEAVILAENISSSDSAMFEVYLEALEALEDRERLKTVINDQFPNEQNPNRLIRYGRLAIDLEEYDIARGIYQKSLGIDPNDDKIVKGLGIVSFHQNLWKEATEHLGLYLSKNEGDWEANYFHAKSIHLLGGKKPEAQKYFLRALVKIGALTQKTHQMKIIEAHCLHRLDRKQEAISAYESLMAESPGDKRVQAAFASALMELGEVNRAENILNM